MLDISYIPEQYRRNCVKCNKELTKESYNFQDTFYCGDSSSGHHNHYSYKININSNRIVEITYTINNSIYVYFGYEQYYGNRFYINIFNTSYFDRTVELTFQEFDMKNIENIYERIMKNIILE